MSETAAAAEQLPATADADDAEEEAEEGSWGALFVNLYYSLVNLGVMLGSIGLLMVAYWLLKWATASSSALSPGSPCIAASCCGARTLCSHAGIALSPCSPGRVRADTGRVCRAVSGLLLQ